jgi:lipoyl(octanoyl) transferase
MGKEPVEFLDLGIMDYQAAWDYQESLLQENVRVKSLLKNGLPGEMPGSFRTRHHLLFVEHPPVYTIGKSGHEENVLINETEMDARGIRFFRTNRGGDITFHGPEQIVGYPILDLEKFGTDIGKYLRNLEEVIIRTMAEYGLAGERSKGETGVWLDALKPGKERKIAALGVRCSRWITMHGFAFNINTDLRYFNHIVPCGIPGKQVSSLEKELGHRVPVAEVKQKLIEQFAVVFNAEVVPAFPLPLREAESR